MLHSVWENRISPEVGGALDLDMSHLFIKRLFSELGIQAFVFEALHDNRKGVTTAAVPITPDQCRNKEVRRFHDYSVTFGSVNMQSDRRWWKLCDEDSGSIYYILTSCGSRVIHAKEEDVGVSSTQYGPGEFGFTFCCEKDGRAPCCGCASE